MSIVSSIFLLVISESLCCTSAKRNGNEKEKEMKMEISFNKMMMLKIGWTDFEVDIPEIVFFNVLMTKMRDC